MPDGVVAGDGVDSGAAGVDALGAGADAGAAFVARFVAGAFFAPCAVAARRSCD